MIYFDSAATSLQKPASVARATARAMSTKASPGRGGHPPAMDAAESVFDCRTAVASFFNVKSPEQVVFTHNATHGLNIAINSLVGPGDAVVLSGYEHNAVVRPLIAAGAKLRVADSPLFDADAALEAFAVKLSGAKCAVCTHVSNVFGFILPIAGIAELCRCLEVPLIIDASQSAGVLPVDFTALGASFIAFPGHKGLLGPQGTGVLLCGELGKPVLFGGTGSSSASMNMPDFLPDRHEAGTHNVAGICGLEKGVSFLSSLPQGAVARHESKLASLFIEQVSGIDSLRAYTSEDPELQAGVVSLDCDLLGCDELAFRLGSRGVCVRAGLHCAPLAHETAGTLSSGTVRFSFSPFNTPHEIKRAAYIIKDILDEAKKSKYKPKNT